MWCTGAPVKKKVLINACDLLCARLPQDESIMRVLVYTVKKKAQNNVEALIFVALSAAWGDYASRIRENQ